MRDLIYVDVPLRFHKGKKGFSHKFLLATVNDVSYNKVLSNPYTNAHIKYYLLLLDYR